MELTPAVKSLLNSAVTELKGRARRLFMARTAQTLGRGGPAAVERELGWSRVTVRKGMRELNSGMTCMDACDQRGRKRAEEHLPHLLSDIKAIVDAQSQADPQFRTQRLYTRMTAAQVRHQLIEQKGYREDALPQAETIGRKLNALGYYPKKVAKSRPKKR